MNPEAPSTAVFKVDVRDLRRSMDDPALRALLSQGWQVLLSVVIEDADGPYLHLVLRPPPAAPPAPVPAPAPLPQEAPGGRLPPSWLVAGAVVVASLSGVLVALFVELARG